MKNIGILAIKKSSLYSGQFQRQEQPPSSWTFTQPIPYDNKNPLSRSMDLSMFDGKDELTKLEISLELNKHATDKGRFVQACIPTHAQSRTANIAAGMFRKIQNIKPDKRCKKTHPNRLVMKQKLQAYLFYDTSKSLEVKYSKSPCAVIAREHALKEKPREKLQPAFETRSPMKAVFKRGENVHAKEHLIPYCSEEKDLSIKVLDSFEAGHNKFKAVLQEATRIVGKLRL